MDLSTAQGIYLGATGVQSVYLGSTLIWPPHDYSQDPLTFEVLEAGQFKFTPSSANTSPIAYSLNNGATWITMQDDTWTATIPAGSKMILDCYEPTPFANAAGIGTFSSTGNFNVSGNIGSLLEGYMGFTGTYFSLAVYQFASLFKNCTYLISAEHLYLPPETIIQECYDMMFYGCTGLTTPPELPATTLSHGCYDMMFGGCTSLTTAPELPATTLADYCYGGMFRGCTSLTTAPELPATTLATGCYMEMFFICTSLTTVTELPATTLAQYCYVSMFSGCTSLTTVPETLPATTLANQCYYDMFSGCASLTTAPELPAPTLANLCYGNMFNICTNLNYVKCLATDLRDASFQTTYNWLNGVSATGTFVKDANTTWPTGSDGIPSGWTIINNA